MSPGEDYMIMTISEKDGEPKLYLSTKVSDNWSQPEYTGDIINEDMTGNFPYITSDGKHLLFTRKFSVFYILPTKSFIHLGN